MKLAETFLLFAWNAHEDCLRHRKRGSEDMAQWYEGRRSAYLFAARLCRDEAKAAVAGTKPPSVNTIFAPLCVDKMEKPLAFTKK